MSKIMKNMCDHCGKVEDPQKDPNWLHWTNPGVVRQGPKRTPIWPITALELSLDFCCVEHLLEYLQDNLKVPL